MSDDPTVFLLDQWEATRVELTADEVDDHAAIQRKMIEQAVSGAADQASEEA